MSVISYPHALSRLLQRLVGYKKEEDAFWYCHNCGTQSPQSVEVCGKCGQKLLITLSVEPTSNQRVREKEAPK